MSDMTCEQIRRHVEEIAQLADREFLSDSSVVAAHVATCTDCGRFIKERQSLGKSLQLLRDSVGSISEVLDSAVLADYRRLMAERTETPPVHAGRVRFALMLRWGAVAALVLLVAAIALVSTRKPIKKAGAPIPQRPSAAAVTPQTGTPEPRIRPVKRVAAPLRRRPAGSEMHPAMRAVAQVPDDFRGLMYCDELSCGGAMDVIRVQLPSSMVAKPASAFRPTSGAVNADVLIGPDGIARGIRIEQREF